MSYNCYRQYKVYNLYNVYNNYNNYNVYNVYNVYNFRGYLFMENYFTFRDKRKKTNRETITVSINVKNLEKIDEKIEARVSFFDHLNASEKMDLRLEILGALLNGDE